VEEENEGKEEEGEKGAKGVDRMPQDNVKGMQGG